MHLPFNLKKNYIYNHVPESSQAADSYLASDYIFAYTLKKSAIYVTITITYGVNSETLTEILIGFDWVMDIMEYAKKATLSKLKHSKCDNV